MFQGSLYDTLAIQAPFKGMHENVEYMPPTEGAQGFATYVQNFLLIDKTLKVRHGTKDILSFLRKDEAENVLGYSPKNIKIRNVEFYKNKTWFLFFEIIGGWSGVAGKEDDGNKIKLTIHNIDDNKKAALEKGALNISFNHVDGDNASVSIERVDEVSELLFDNNAATLSLPPIVKDKNKGEYYKANDLKEIRFITGELVVFIGQDVNDEENVILKKTHLGTRGVVSHAYNENYFIFATGIDPIIVFDANINNFVKPLCYIERRPRDADTIKGNEEVSETLYPVMTSLLYYNNNFFGLLVDKSGETSLLVAYSKEVGNPRNWFSDQLIQSEDDDVEANKPIDKVSILKLDLSAMHGCNDSLLSIVAFDKDLVFIGKRKIQLWNRGSFNLKQGDPDRIRIESMRNSEGVGLEFDTYQVHLKTLTAQWKKTFDIGAISQGCIAHTNIGIFFVSRGGVRLIAYDESFVNPIIKIHSISGVDLMLKNYFANEKERSPVSFVYNVGGLFGFRFGSTCIVGNIQNNSFLGWTSFSGSFAADDFTLDANGNLIMFRDEFDIYPAISVYDDGRAPMEDFYNIKYHNPEHKNAGSYSDQVWVKKENIEDYSVEDAYIDIEFTVPLDIGGKFACKYLLVLADYFTTMNLDPGNKIEFVVGSDLPNVSFSNTDVSSAPVSGSNRTAFRWMGDKFYTLKIEQSRMSETGASPLIERCKFVGQRFKVGLIGSLRYTEFSFKKIELYGIVEKY